MGAAANSPFCRRRASWVLAVYCLALVAAVAWSVTHAVHLLNGPSVILPGDGYAAVAVTPDGRTLYAANPGPDSNDSGHTVTPVDIATGKAGKPITVGTGPQELAVTPDGKTLYVAEYDDTVIPVNLATGRPGTPIIIESADLALESAFAITPDGKTLYAALNGDYGGGSGPNSMVAIRTASGTVQ